MKDLHKTKKQLAEEVEALGKELVKLKKAERKRRQAEKTLKTTNERLNYLLTSTSAAIYTAKTSGDYGATSITENIKQMTGYEPREFIENSSFWIDRVHPEDRERILNELPGIFEQETYTYEYRFLFRDGNYRWVRDDMKLVRDKHGNPIEIIGYWIDITERKQAEEALRESEEKYRDLVERANDGIVIGQDGILRYVNPRLAHMGGYTVEELTGAPIFDFFFPQDRAKFIDRYKRRLAGEDVPTVYESTLKHKNGSTIEVEINAGVISYNGKPADLVLIRDITERKRAEEKLGESEKKYRAVVEISPDGIAIASKGRHVFANQSLARIFRVSGPDDLLGKPMMDYIHPDYREIVRERIEKLIKGGALAPLIEEKMIRADGTVIQTEVAAAPLEYQGEQAVLAIIRDITDRKHAEAALRESEENFRRSLDDSPLGLRIVTSEGETLYANQAALEIYGYDSVGELERTPVKERYTPESYAEFRTRKEKRERSEFGLSEYEISIVRKNGEIRRVQVFRKEVIWNGQRQFQVIYHDITERKQAEEALRQSEERYRTILEDIEEGYFESNLTGRPTFLNDSMCKIHGYPREELLEINYRHFTDKKNGKKVFQAFNQVYRTGKPGKLFDYEIIRKDGTKRQVEVITSLRKDSSGNPIGFRGITRDVTERKQAEATMESLQEQLRQSQKMEAIGRLAGGIAHDFNNLLTIIKGYSQLSMIELKEDNPLKKNIERIHGATDRAANLVRQLLAFSRRQIMEVKVLDLNAILRNLDNMLRRVIGEDIELVTVLAEDLGRVKSDPSWIEQAIMNLAVNARDAMASGGKLTIETGNVDLDEAYTGGHVAVEPGRYVMLSVSDTGAGMSPEVMERLFEPFFSTKEKDKGTGLGLSTVYGIVKQSEGDIWVYSEPGKGATFKIYLPRVHELLEEQREKAVGDELSRGNETVLLVEDDEEVRKLALRVLERQGYKVLAARQGDEALLMCEQHKGPIHLMLTDVVMPGMNGRELAKRLESSHPETKVLYMSGYTDHAIVAHGVLVQGVHYIQKPFTVEALAKKVREVLER